MFFSCGIRLYRRDDGLSATRGALAKCRRHFIRIVGAAGVCAYAFGYVVNWYPGLTYGFFDYSLTSPQFFLVRLGYMWILLYLAYWWSRRPRAARWSPLLLFGQTSLLIYWVHIEFVYGRLRMFRNSLSLGWTAVQLLWLVPLMVMIAWFSRWRASDHPVRAHQMRADTPPR